jgi:hypothetical protein
MAQAAGQVEIANQVFIGCPWKTVRAKYERAIGRLNQRFPLSLVIVGRGDSQEAEDLLEIIKDRLLSSSYAIFDATTGNANVSLEFGLAEASEIPRALYVSSHAASRHGTDSPIIADLAGKRRNQYTQETRLRALLTEMAKGHPYNKRFESFLQKRFGKLAGGRKKRTRSLALKIIHQLDGVKSRRRADIVQALQADAAHYSRIEIDDMIAKLHAHTLIRSLQGPYSTVTIR